MDEPKKELIRNWLVKAQHDLASARKLASEPDPYLDTAIFHCQQAAEKAVKAVLVFHDQRHEKTHDIRRLLNLAAGFDRKLTEFLQLAATLTPYSTAFRYPDEKLSPDQHEFRAALEAADKIVEYIFKSLPPEVQP